MTTVYKYPLCIRDTQALVLPVGATILSAKFQGDELFLWALVDTEARKEVRTVLVIGTGHAVHFEPDRLQHIDTVHAPSAGLVLHVFAVRLPAKGWA